MQKHNLDILVASLPEHLLYLLDFTILGATYQTKTQNYAVCSSDLTQPRRLVISASDAPTALEFSDEVELVCHGGYRFNKYSEPLSPFARRLQEQIEHRENSPADALIEAIRRFSGKKLRIGIDELRTPVTTWNKVAAAYPDAGLIPALPVFEEIRSIKHPDEIKLIRKASGIAEDSLLAALDHTKLGDSEYAIGMDYRAEVANRFAHGYFCTCTIDQRTAYSDTCHKKHSVISDGSVIRFDFGAIFEFYHSDLARTVMVGKTNPEVEGYYSAILAGLDEAINCIKPGAMACDIFHTAVEAVRKNGIPHYERSHVGHGIGLQIYDMPSITAQSQAILEPGMVLCIETPYYEIGKWGIQIEDTIVVTETGYARLTHTQNDLIKIM